MADDDKGTKDTPETVSKEKFDTEVQNAIKLRERAQTAEGELSKVNERIAKIEADQKKASETANKTKLEGEDKYEEALAAQKQSMQDQLDAKDARIGVLEGSLTDVFGTQALAAELGKAGVKSEVIGQAAQLLGSRVKVEYVDGAPKVTVLGADGAPMFVGADPATVAQLVGAWTPENKHFLPPNGDTGSGGHPGGEPGDNAGLTQQGLLANPIKHQEFIAGYDTPEESRAAFRKLPPKKE